MRALIQITNTPEMLKTIERHLAETEQLNRKIFQHQQVHGVRQSDAASFIYERQLRGIRKALRDGMTVELESEFYAILTNA